MSGVFFTLSGFLKLNRILYGKDDAGRFGILTLIVADDTFDLLSNNRLDLACARLVISLSVLNSRTYLNMLCRIIVIHVKRIVRRERPAVSANRRCRDPTLESVSKTGAIRFGGKSHLFAAKGCAQATARETA